MRLAHTHQMRVCARSVLDALVYNVWFIWIFQLLFLQKKKEKQANTHQNSPSTQLNADCQHRLNAYDFSHFLIYSDLNRWKKNFFDHSKNDYFSSKKYANSVPADDGGSPMNFTCFVRQLIFCDTAKYLH